MAEENSNELSDEALDELTARAQKIVDGSKAVRVSTIVMLSAWRLFYAARKVIEQDVQEEKGLDKQDEDVIMHILASSLYEKALEPYKVQELVATLSEICIPFLQLQEDNISEELKEEGDENDD
jgi:hypothetical protein